MSIVFDTHDLLVVVHAVVAGIAVLGTAPAAALAGRYMRRRRWFVWHRALNIATVVLVILAFGLGTAAVASQDDGTQFSGPSRDLHHDMGLALLLLVALQAVGGFLAAHTAKPGEVPSAKGWIRRFHVSLGLAVIALMLAESWVGFDEWDVMQSTGTLTPDAVRYLYLLIAGAEIAAYLYASGRTSLDTWTKVEKAASSVRQLEDLATLS